MASSKYLRGISRGGGNRPYVPIQDLREGRPAPYMYIYIYTRINAPGEIPLSASGDKYYKLGWLLSFPSLSPPCRATRNTTIILTFPLLPPLVLPPTCHRSCFFVLALLSRFPSTLSISKPTLFPSLRSPMSGWFFLWCPLTKPPLPRGSRTPPSQPNIYIYIALRSPSLPAQLCSRWSPFFLFF